MSDPAVCPDCKGAMRPLFTGFYCPNNCDKPQAKAKKLSDVPVEVIADIYKKIYGAQQGAIATPRVWSPFGGMFPVTPNHTPAMADDQCRDFYCSGKGAKTHVVFTNLGSPNATEETHYTCQTCTCTWHIDKLMNQAPLTVNGNTITFNMAEHVELRWNGKTWVRS